MARILVVDDDPHIRGLLSEVLEMNGHEVSEATNGREALEHLQLRPSPEVILLDLRMPEMSGGEFLKADQSSIPVVVITAETNVSSLLPVYDRIVSVLRKPFSLDALFDAISRVCLGYRAT